MVKALLRTCFCRHCQGWRVHTIVVHFGEKFRWCGECARVTLCHDNECEACDNCNSRLPAGGGFADGLERDDGRPCVRRDGGLPLSRYAG
jgi:hypothetical protein